MRSRILFDHSVSGKILELHTLEIYGLTAPVIHFKTKIIPALAKLKVLDISPLEKWTECEELLSKIVQQAPNLEKIKGCLEPHRGRNFPQDKYSMLDHFYLSIMSDNDYSLCSRFDAANPALSILHLSSPFKWRQYKNKYLRVLEQLMTSSQKSLTKLGLESVAFPFSQLGLPALINLRVLRIRVRESSQLVVNLLWSLNYPEFRPALTETDITADLIYYKDRKIVERVPMPADFRPSATTRSLKLDLDVNPQLLHDLSCIFPNVNSLMVELRARPALPYGDVWSCWPQLESIEVMESCESLGVDFDRQFLGINPEEVELLRELDDESVGKLNIVPIRPSVLTLQQLRYMMFQFGATAGSKRKQATTETVLLANLWSSLAFRKLENMGAVMKIKRLCEGCEITIIWRQ